MENHIGELFILPLAIIAVLLLYLIHNKHSPTTKRAWIISAIVIGIIIYLLLILSIAIPFVGILFAFMFLLNFSIWTIAATLIIGTAISAFITWRHKSKPPPRKTILIRRKPPPDDNDNES